MPDEPNKKMDELLKAYAEERRKAPEVPLHPATRNILRGEVQRVFGSGHTRPWWHELRSWWPQLAFGGSMCLILGIAILSLRHTPPTTEEKSQVAPQVNESLERAPESLIKQKAGAASPAASKERSAPEDVSLGTPLMDRIDDSTPAPDRKRDIAHAPVANLGRDGNSINPSDVKSRQLSTALPAAPKEPQVNLQQKFETALKEHDAVQETRLESSAANARTDPEPSTAKSNARQAARPAMRASAPAPTAAGPAILTPETLALAAEMTNLGAARRLNFVQTTNAVGTAGASLGNPATPPILTSFQVEQLGTNLRVFDQDGSVYLGSLEPTNTLSVEEAQISIPADQAVINNSAAYFFRAQGTNRTLGRDVVLTGNYFEKTNRQPSSLDTFSIAPNARPQPQPRYLIIGNATLSETNQVPLRAISNEP